MTGMLTQPYTHLDPVPTHAHMTRQMYSIQRTGQTHCTTAYLERTFSAIASTLIQQCYITPIFRICSNPG